MAVLALDTESLTVLSFPTTEASEPEPPQEIASTPAIPPIVISLVYCSIIVERVTEAFDC